MENPIFPSGFLAVETMAKHIRPITIYVRDKNGQSLRFEKITPYTPLLELMLRVQDQTGLPPTSQRLQFRGKPLEPLHKIKDYPNIGHEDTLELQSRIRGGSEEYNTIDFVYDLSMKRGNLIAEVWETRGESSAKVWWGRNVFMNKKEGYPDFAKKTLERLNQLPGDTQFDMVWWNQNVSRIEAIVFSEGLKVGNCQEYGNVACQRVLDTSENQWVYHARMYRDNGNGGNAYSHAFCITYPEKTTIEKMDTKLASVVDSWENNTDCSLKDFMKGKRNGLPLNPYGDTLSIQNIRAISPPEKAQKRGPLDDAIIQTISNIVRAGFAEFKKEEKCIAFMNKILNVIQLFHPEMKGLKRQMKKDNPKLYENYEKDYEKLFGDYKNIDANHKGRFLDLDMVMDHQTKNHKLVIFDKLDQLRKKGLSEALKTELASAPREDFLRFCIKRYMALQSLWALDDPGIMKAMAKYLPQAKPEIFGKLFFKILPDTKDKDQKRLSAFLKEYGTEKLYKKLLKKIYVPDILQFIIKGSVPFLEAFCNNLTDAQLLQLVELAAEIRKPIFKLKELSQRLGPDTCEILDCIDEVRNSIRKGHAFTASTRLKEHPKAILKACKEKDIFPIVFMDPKVRGVLGKQIEQVGQEDFRTIIFERALCRGNERGALTQFTTFCKREAKSVPGRMLAPTFQNNLSTLYKSLSSAMFPEFCSIFSYQQLALFADQHQEAEQRMNKNKQLRTRLEIARK